MSRAEKRAFDRARMRALQDLREAHADRWDGLLQVELERARWADPDAADKLVRDRARNAALRHLERAYPAEFLPRFAAHRHITRAEEGIGDAP